MKDIYSQSEGADGIGTGFFKRWVGCVLGVVLFLSAAGSVALAQSSAMTQQQYLQWMANICGEALPASATDADLINWARGKGMNPSGGWNLSAKLTKAVVAQTLVQLLNLAPRKGNFDAIRILEREGIFITSTDGYVTVRNIVQIINDGFVGRVNPNRKHGDDGDGDDDNGGPSRDDDDGTRPTGTKPGHGHGDQNHDHTGPPGLSGDRPGKGNQRR